MIEVLGYMQGKGVEHFKHGAIKLTLGLQPTKRLTNSNPIEEPSMVKIFIMYIHF
jgi:hypothetical protein